MRQEDPAQRLADIASAVRGELERADRDRSCVFAGAVLTQLLRQEGHGGACPLVVQAAIFNPLFFQRFQSRGKIPDDTATLGKWLADGCRMVSLGTDPVAPGSGEWADGHLGVVVPRYFGDRHAFVDVTLPRASRPELNISLTLAVLRVTDSFVRGETEFATVMNGCMVAYLALPDIRSYAATEAWNDTGLRDAVVSRVLEARMRLDQTE